MESFYLRGLFFLSQEAITTGQSQHTHKTTKIRSKGWRVLSNLTISPVTTRNCVSFSLIIFYSPRRARHIASRQLTFVHAYVFFSLHYASLGQPRPHARNRMWRHALCWPWRCYQASDIEFGLRAKHVEAWEQDCPVPAVAASCCLLSYDQANPG